MTERWQDYFRGEKGKYHGTLEYAVHQWNYHEPLYARIKRVTTPPARILDIGCGQGFSDIYLSGCGYEVTGIDNDDEIVSQARSHADYFHSDAIFEKADTFDLSRFYGRFALVYSVGVVEHFDRDTTVRLLREQARCGKYVLVIIPTSYTRYSGKVTDERLYRMPQLRAMVRRAGMRVVDTFGYGDIYSPFHRLVRRLLPHGIYRFAQNRFSYAMEIGCIGLTEE